MEYSKILKRALDILLTNKYLVILGLLVALGSAGGSRSSIKWTTNGADSFGQPVTPPAMPGMEGFWGGWVFIALLVSVLLLFAFAIAFAVLIVSSVARGGLVSSVETIEKGETSSFGDGWRAGWEKLWPLVGINVLPAIPILVAVFLGLLVLFFTVGIRGLTNMPQIATLMIGGSAALLIAMFCLLVPVTIVLGLLRTFAVRACMLEQQGVWASYRQGWNVAMENLGSALILALLQFAISIGVGVLMIGPSLFMIFCFLLWPIFFLIQGAISAYFSTVWTLAWREWTGRMEIDLI